MKIPTTPLARRVAALVKRRPTTPWSEREERQYKKLFKAGCFNALADLELLEQFYTFQHKRGDDGIHRRDLLTLLNNYGGELDKATLWRERHPLKQPPRKIIPLPLIQSEPFVPTSDPSELAALARFEEERLRRKAMGKV
jgi:hypothetical protein